MGQITCRKMALDETFQKTGGSHLVFHCLGTICDVKKMVRTAALPGILFKDQKYDNYRALF